jgi:encapsulating protein for peroxidase
MVPSAASAAVPLGTSHADYPGAVSAALTKLRDDGIEGPFAVVLNEQLYKDLAARTASGYPILSHVQRLVDGDIVWAAMNPRPAYVIYRRPHRCLVGRTADGIDSPARRASARRTSPGQGRFSAAVITTTQTRPVACSCAGDDTTKAGLRWRTGRSV